MSNRDVVYGLEDAVDAVNNDLPRVLDIIGTNQPQLCELLHALREQRIRLAEIEATVEAKAARAMGPADRIEWPGYYAERKGGAVRKHWDNGLLAARVVRYGATDFATGEIDPDAETIGKAVAADILDAAAVSYWRTSILRSLGIEFDDAVVTERGRRTVRVTKGSAA